MSYLFQVLYYMQNRVSFFYFFFTFPFYEMKKKNGLGSLTGGPLLMMELAFLLRGVGSDVVWITNQKPAEPDQVIYSLESKLLDRGVQVIYFPFLRCYFGECMYH